MENEQLVGEELLSKIRDLKEDEDAYVGLQERVYECGYSLKGNPNYKDYFKAIADAYDKKEKDIFLDYFPETEIPFLAFEIAKLIKVMFFYDDLIDDLNHKNIEFFEAFKIIKNFELRINYKDIYKTGFIKDKKNIEETNKTLKGQNLIKKITNKYGLLEYNSELIIDCGYIKYDNDFNEYADVIGFFEEVTKTKNINLDCIDLNDFDSNQVKENIQDLINTDRKYYAFDFTCFSDADELELYALTDQFTWSCFKRFKIWILWTSQEFRPIRVYYERWPK